MSSNYTNWKSYTSNSKRNHLAHRSVCTWDVTNSLLIVLYIILFFCCLLLLKENSSSWQSGQSGGLLWYLSCTSVLCGCRFIGFALILYIGTGVILQPSFLSLTTILSPLKLIDMTTFRAFLTDPDHYSYH